MGDVLLGEGLGHHHPAFLGAGVLQQCAGDAAVDVQGGQGLDHVIGVAQALGQALQQALGELVGGLEQAPEVGLADHAQLGVLHGQDPRGARLGVDQGHLPEVVAGPEQVDDDLLAVLLGQVDLHPPFLDQVQPVPGVPLPEDHRSPGAAPGRGEPAHGFHGLRGESGEEGNVAEG